MSPVVQSPSGEQMVRVSAAARVLGVDPRWIKSRPDLHVIQMSERVSVMPMRELTALLEHGRCGDLCPESTAAGRLTPANENAAGWNRRRLRIR